MSRGILKIFSVGVPVLVESGLSGLCSKLGQKELVFVGGSVAGSGRGGQGAVDILTASASGGHLVRGGLVECPVINGQGVDFAAVGVTAPFGLGRDTGVVLIVGGDVVFHGQGGLADEGGGPESEFPHTGSAVGGQSVVGTAGHAEVFGGGRVEHGFAVSGGASRAFLEGGAVDFLEFAFERGQVFIRGGQQGS